MVIRDVPHDIENYYMADADTAFILHQQGFQPKYIDGNIVYFKINNKLLKTLKKLNVEL